MSHRRQGVQSPLHLHHPLALLYPLLPQEPLLPHLQAVLQDLHHHPRRQALELLLGISLHRLPHHHQHQLQWPDRCHLLHPQARRKPSLEQTCLLRQLLASLRRQATLTRQPLLISVETNPRSATSRWTSTTRWKALSLAAKVNSNSLKLHHHPHLQRRPHQ